MQDAVGVDGSGCKFGWAAPPVSAVSPVGSGDAFFAGIAVGLLQGQALKDAVRLGVAAGAANTLQIDAGRLNEAEVEALLGQAKAMEALGSSQRWAIKIEAERTMEA
ncbi:MAG: PfkB family carbohydrate kinase [Anaerolineales bacterium]